ncbi:uncharacterized protein LOC116202014 [Punica granatum]|uniref:VQ domain-containing protein n=2 Tax=Punica granatum TaxID=22663 RepID=A0A218XLC3_PUNGR|nr:uncharacterized protein LOC116202014 [Punica granatum]OWM85476.1 hypothetical protein CDL15_Pgr019100 [Punica granatum]PKI50846.1 hypothetical protein CRG98_028753 [Punica granatum]
MDNLGCSVQQRKPTKFKAKPAKRKPKPMNSPIKVVYISNPMRVKATASEFRALVQELTGQDSELPDPAKFSPGGANDPHRAVSVDDVAKDEGTSGLGGVSAAEDDDEPVQEVPSVGLELSYGPLLSGDAPTPSEVFDEDPDGVFTPQMLDNLVGLCPSNFLCGSYSDLNSFALLSHCTAVPTTNDNMVRELDCRGIN